MKIQNHTNYLIQLTKFRFINGFLVREQDGFTLVDSSLSGDGPAILAAAAAEGLAIKRVALTHAHVDHAGALDELADQLEGVEFLFSERTERFLAGDFSPAPGEPEARLRGGFPARQTRASRYISAGDRIGSLEVLAAPGHTPDHIAFLDSRDGTLIAGDAFQTMGGTVVSGTLNLRFPFPAFATWHKPTALQTARELRALGPQRLAVGHGPVLESPLDAIDRAIRKAA